MSASQKATREETDLVVIVLQSVQKIQQNEYSFKSSVQKLIQRGCWTKSITVGAVTHASFIHTPFSVSYCSMNSLPSTASIGSTTRSTLCLFLPGTCSLCKGKLFSSPSISVPQRCKFCQGFLFTDIPQSRCPSIYST